jgi:predicted ATPase
MALSMEQGFAYFAAQAMIMLGWGLVLQGQHAEGMTQMQQGLENHRATERVVGESYFLALLAEAHGIRGTPQTGLRVVTKALAYVGRSGEGWWEAELYRLKGALLLLRQPMTPQQLKPVSSRLWRLHAVSMPGHSNCGR